MVTANSERKDLIPRYSGFAGNEQHRWRRERFAMRRTVLPTMAAVYDESCDKRFMTEKKARVWKELGAVWLQGKRRKLHCGMESIN